MKTYRLFFVSVYRFIWNTFLYDISSILLIIIFKLYTPFLNFFNRLLLKTVIVLINTSITIDKALPNSTCWTISPVNLDEIRIGNKAKLFPSRAYGVA